MNKYVPIVVEKCRREGCGNDVHRTPMNIATGARKFCCRPCLDAYIRSEADAAAIIVKCKNDNCNNQIRRTPHDVRTNQRMYCSGTCGAQQRIINEGTARTIAKCSRPDCEIMVSRKPSDKENGKGFFCSLECYFKARKLGFTRIKGKITRADLKVEVIRLYSVMRMKDIAAQVNYSLSHLDRIVRELKAENLLPEKAFFPRKQKAKKEKPQKAPKPSKPVKEKRLPVHHETMKRAPKKEVKRLPNKIVDNSEFIWVQIDSRTRVQRRKAS